ncbi:MAG: STAS-like domain-containing protein, partial [Salinispira sp.]
DYIEPYFQKNAEDTVSVDIDGVKGYPPSFFEEVFGGLSRIYGVQRTRKLKILCSNDYVKNRIIRYIDHGREK